VLGLGEDGHVASLIAGATGYEAAMAGDAGPVVAIHAPGAAGAADRISLSFREITASRRVILVFVGEAKRAVFDAATLSPLRELVRTTTVEAHWSA
jgi:6-phosphogluconolactonase